METKTINQQLIAKTGKNFWQWSSAIAFFLGVLFQLVAMVTHSMFFMLGMFVLWGYALWCAAFMPAEGENK